MDNALFVLFAAVAIVSAVLSVTRKNTVAAACWLVLLFFGLAGVYVLLQAFFVGVIQILVYAGAIMVLFLFVIMLLDLRNDELLAHKGPRLKVLGVLLSAVFFGIVIYAITDAGASKTAVADRISLTLRAPGEEPRSLALTPEDPVGVTWLSEWFQVGGKPEKYRSYVTLGRAPGARGPTVQLVDEFQAYPPLSTDVRGRAVLQQAGIEVEVAIQRGGLEAARAGGPDGSPRAVGESLFEVWLLPFEIASLLLTGAIFGAVVLTKRRLA